MRSRSPYSLISKAAVLIPIPGAPGTLSTNRQPAPAHRQRVRARRRISRARRRGQCVCSSSRRTFQRRRRPVASDPCPTDDGTAPTRIARLTAKVAIMSSASNPSISSQAMLNARVASRVSGICGRKSSGIASRLALYWSYMSLRNVWLPLSKITATWVAHRRRCCPRHSAATCCKTRDRPDGQPVRFARQRRQRVVGAKDERRAVDQVQVAPFAKCGCGHVACPAANLCSANYLASATPPQSRLLVFGPLKDIM